MRAKQTISLAVLVVVVLVAAACGGSDDPAEEAALPTEQATTQSPETADPTPSATESPTPSPEPTPTLEPALAPQGWTIANPEAPWAARAGLRVVELDSTLYMLGGRTPVDSIIPAESDFWGDVWVSADSGVSWEQILETDNASHWAARAYFQSVTKDGLIYILGGQDFQLPQSTFFNDVWSSPDGVSWTQLRAAAPWDGRAGLSAAVLDGYIYVLGGSRKDDDALIGPTGPPRIYYNDVWRSNDGVNWELVTAAAPWEPRAGAVLLVKDDRLVLLGGEDGFTCEPLPDCDPPYFNDVWSSADGANWELVTEAAAWSKRPGHACEVIENTIYCFGGFGLIENPIDMWSSPDGATWTEVNQVPWNAADPSEIKYDFAWISVESGPGGLPSILTLGGDRETFDFDDPENYLRVDDDVWSFDGG